MKKLFFLALVFLLFGTGVTSAKNKDIRIVVDQAMLYPDSAPIIKNSRTMVPVRSIFEYLGAAVAWDASRQKITISTDRTEIILYLNRTDAYVNGVPTTIDAAPFLSQGRTLVPVRFITETMGYQLLWNGQYSVVYIATDSGLSSSGKKRVVLDPGHGGANPGTTSYFGSYFLKESEINLDIALATESLLETLGVDVTMTRTLDQDVSLSHRASLANSSGAHLFVSIHNNSSASGAYHGSMVLYSDAKSYSSSSLTAAEKIQNALVSTLFTKDIGAQVRNDLYVLNQTTMPAVLVEVAFLDHPTDKNRLMTEEFRRDSAIAIASGIMRSIH